MADLPSIRRTLTRATAERDRLARQLADEANALDAERSRFAAQQAVGEADAAKAATRRIRDLEHSRATTARRIAALHEKSRVDLDRLLGRSLELEGDFPLVLLPVRVETRSTPDNSSLRVRIFPDAVHAEKLQEGVSDAERLAGIAYWRDVWITGDTAALWPALVSAVGSERAPWVAEALRPTNLSERLSSPPAFPNPPALNPHSPIVRTLPDRFFVRVEQDGAAPKTAIGNAIPDNLPIGLINRDGITRLQLDDQDLPPIDESLRWLVEYAEAERVGMALTVPLPRPGQPVRRLLVYGVRASLDPDSSAVRIENLIRSHRFTDGAEFLAQGTPTNNTDSVRTDWSRRKPAALPSINMSDSLDATTNAGVAARALGIDVSVLASLPGSADREQARAAAFNTALWATTWGDAIEFLTPAGRANGDQRLDSPSLDAVRDHWVDHVRGRGPVPVLRLGRQPYGLLPIVATDASWRPLRGGFVEDRLVPFIDQQIRWMWNDAIPTARSVMSESLDTALPYILGTDAVLRGLRVRTALSPDPILGTAMALTLPDLGNTTSGQQATRAVLILSGIADDELTDNTFLGTKTRSLSLPLVDDSDLEFIAGLLQPTPKSMAHRSVLQVLVAHAVDVDRQRQESVAPTAVHSMIREAIASNTAGADRALLTRAFNAVADQTASGGRASVSSSIISQASAHLKDQVGVLDSRVLADRYPVAAVAAATLAEQVAGGAVRPERLAGRAGMQLVGEIFRRSSWSTAMRAALEEIAKITSLEERRLLLSETLDCCSHRLDAWLTAAASRRLDDMRDLRARGAFFGAYALLENIELRSPDSAGTIDEKKVLHDRSDGGYIHAPGLTHAVAAGILRSGRLTHRRSDPNSDALDIDLSSGRVRDALTLLDGMRRGQSLGALLGYRLERRLHERSGDGFELDRFIYVLRTLAPLRGGKLSEPGKSVEESIAASDVVDGLRLMDIPTNTIKKKLIDGPDDTRYIQPPDHWVPPGPGEAEAVLSAIAELDETHDAVADLLLAESVYQLAAGNPERAAAVLDVLGAGEAVPPEPEVVRTPRSGVPIQHRVAIIVPDPLPAPLAGWNADTPRARAEPRLERWAQGALGEADAISITASGNTLADAHLSALDVLYDADGDSVENSTLAARLTALVDEVGDDLSVIAPLWDLAGMLRAVLLSGRSLDTADLGRPVEEDAIGRVPDANELFARATEALESFKEVAKRGVEDELLRFGVRQPPSQKSLAPTPSERSAARDAMVAAANKRIAEAEALLAQAAGGQSIKERVEAASKALAAMFGSNFLAVPVLLPPPLGEQDPWSGAVGPAGVTALAGAQIRPWLARAASFRSATSSFGESVLVREVQGRRPLLRVIQTPVGAYGTWAGLAFDTAPPTVPLACMVAEVAGVSSTDPEPALDQAVAGVVLDEWTEVVPRRMKRKDPNHPTDEAKFVDVTTTGVAINANGPGARPPQAILLALSADGKPWDEDRLVNVLNEALSLARMRTLTLQDVPFIGRVLPALYFRDWSLQGESVIQWSKAALSEVQATMKFLSVSE